MLNYIQTYDAQGPRESLYARLLSAIAVEGDAFFFLPLALRHVRLKKKKVHTFHATHETGSDSMECRKIKK